MINDRGSNGTSFAYLSPQGEFRAVLHKYKDGLSSLGVETDCSYNNLYKNHCIYNNSTGSLFFPATSYNSNSWSKSPTSLTHDNHLIIKGIANPILYGPYISLGPGKYRAEFTLKAEERLSLDWKISFTSDCGNIIAAKFSRIRRKLLPNVDTVIACMFELKAPAENFEVVVHQDGQIEFSFLSLRIFTVYDQ